MEKRFHKKRQMAHVDRYKQKLATVPVSNSAHVSVIGTGANGLGRSFLLRTSSDRFVARVFVYLFCSKCMEAGRNNPKETKQP